MYTGKFRTIIFTKRNIIRWLCYFISGVVIAVAMTAIKSDMYYDTGMQTNIASRNIYLSILENELPIKSEKKKSISELIGFDIKNPQTILSYYSPLFENVHQFADEQINETIPQSTPVQEQKENTEIINASGGLKITNATKYQVNLNEFTNKKLPFTIDDNGPQVLIVHTHTTESYTENNSYKSSDRTTDETKNIVAVGDVIEEVFRQNQIQTVHDVTVHDYPSYNGAYTRALATIKENIEKYPSIKVVLDVHRDGITRDDGTKVKILTDINNEPCAQVMIVAGSDASGLSHEHWRDNMTFAAHIQDRVNKKYPSLIRPLNLREERFNTHLTKGSIILEIGSNGNTLDEAKLGAKYMAEIICEVLKQ